MRTLAWIFVTILLTTGILFLLARSNSAVRSAFNLGSADSDAKRADTLQLWPSSNAWTWTFPRPKAGGQTSLLSIRIREKSEPLQEGVTLPIGGGPVTSRADANRELGTAMAVDLADSDGPATATIQLVDLSEIGAVSDKPGHTLRVLGKFYMDGGTVRISKSDTYLPAGHFVGHWIPTDTPSWVKDEMHLMTFYVESDTHRYKFDVIVHHTLRDPQQ